MSATDELRKLLDERGVEWTYSIGPFPQTNWEVGDVVWHAKELTNGLDVATRYLTPEQAIAATVGRGTCEWQGSVGQGWCQGVYDETRDEYAGFFATWHILGCGHGVLMADDEKPNYCLSCGREVRQ